MTLLAAVLLLILVTSAGKVHSCCFCPATLVGQRVSVWCCVQRHAQTEQKGKNKIRNENNTRCLRLKLVVTWSVLTSGHVMGPQLHHVTAMNGDCPASPDVGFG